MEILKDFFPEWVINVLRILPYVALFGVVGIISSGMAHSHNLSTWLQARKKKKQEKNEEKIEWLTKLHNMRGGFSF